MKQRIKVLFVSRAKANKQPSPIIQAQLESISNLCEAELFLIRGKGVWAYLISIGKLRKYIKLHRPDIIHAHYSFSAFISSIASSKPVICSIMGSDIQDSFVNRMITRFFLNHFWRKVIVKSEYLSLRSKLYNAEVIPNGVNLNLFKPEEQSLSRNILKIDQEQIVVLFPANPSRPEKNFKLAQKAISILQQKINAKLMVIHNINQLNIPTYINASNVILSTSHFEGSSNIVKEAMACNVPVVSTDVGDARFLFDRIPGYYICDKNAEDVANKLAEALEFINTNRKTEGRNQIIKLKLDQDSVAKKIVSIYNNVLSN